MTMLDRSRPAVRVKDFNSGSVTLEQDGKKFSESGYELLLPANAFKYGCPKCDYRTDNAGLLLAHAAAVHHASDELVACYKTYIQNIDRLLPPDEGIDWHRLQVVRSSAQIAIDEHEAANREVAKPHANFGQPAEKTAGVQCAHCPRTFKNGDALAGHMKFHSAKK